jgi:hypothetical protein
MAQEIAPLPGNFQLAAVRQGFYAAFLSFLRSRTMPLPARNAPVAAAGWSKAHQRAFGARI